MATLAPAAPALTLASAEENAPAVPLSEAAVKLGDLLRTLTAKRGDAIVIATIKESLAHVLDGARELGTVQREVARLQRYATRVENANSRLVQLHCAAHAEREQLLKDLAPALDVVADVFNRAREQRDSLAPSSRPYVPPSPTSSADALDGYREAPVEAHHED
jgi:hypothetical protein